MTTLDGDMAGGYTYVSVPSFSITTTTEHLDSRRLDTLHAAWLRGYMVYILCTGYRSFRFSWALQGLLWVLQVLASAGPKAWTKCAV